MKKKYLFAALFLLLIITLWRFDLQALLYSLRQFPMWIIGALILLQIATQLLVNLQWCQIAKFSKIGISFWEMLRINCGGAVVDSVTPGVKVGGDVARTLQIRRATNCSVNQAVALVALQKLFSMSVFLLICFFSVIRLIGEVPYLHLAIFVMAGLVLISTVAIYILRHKLREILHILRERIYTLRANPIHCIQLVLLPTLIWLIYPAKMYFLAVQIHPAASFIHVGAIAFVAYVIAMLPIFPGGLGGYEVTMAGLLLVAGFMHTDALVITVLFRFITFWLVVLLSVAFVAYCRVRQKRLENIRKSPEVFEAIRP